MTYECDADYFNLATGESTDDEYGCSWWEGDEGQKGEVAKQCHNHKEIARRE